MMVRRLYPSQCDVSFITMIINHLYRDPDGSIFGTAFRYAYISRRTYMGELGEILFRVLMLQNF